MKDEDKTPRKAGLEDQTIEETIVFEQRDPLPAGAQPSASEARDVPPVDQPAAPPTAPPVAPAVGQPTPALVPIETQKVRKSRSVFALPAFIIAVSAAVVAVIALIVAIAGFAGPNHYRGTSGYDRSGYNQPNYDQPNFNQRGTQHGTHNPRGSYDSDDTYGRRGSHGPGHMMHPDSPRSHVPGTGRGLVEDTETTAPEETGTSTTEEE